MSERWIIQGAKCIWNFGGFTRFGNEPYTPALGDVAAIPLPQNISLETRIYDAASDLPDGLKLERLKENSIHTGAVWCRVVSRQS